ncbi:hypothetical protein CK203_101865 [Vitis vinifera]|uniref:Uncharacterized protein n=1 Tax=Vitis vinifera TaxID=29760 RepID=A0A438CGJ2_VITVI|nr:hypothetical protein CK203_101865 [Vitis vinifera]
MESSSKSSSSKRRRSVSVRRLSRTAIRKWRAEADGLGFRPSALLGFFSSPGNLNFPILARSKEATVAPHGTTAGAAVNGVSAVPAVPVVPPVPAAVIDPVPLMAPPAGLGQVSSSCNAIPASGTTGLECLGGFMAGVMADDGCELELFPRAYANMPFTSLLMESSRVEDNDFFF